MSPTYSYKCKKCNHIFEEMRCMSESNDTAACPCCGLKSERKITGGTSFILKGNDWPGKVIKENRGG